MKEEAGRRGGEEKVLPTSSGTKTLRISELVFGSSSGPMLLGSVNSFCNCLQKFMSSAEELGGVFSLKDEGFHCHVLNPQYFSTTRDAACV